jgi:mannitol-1-/sugar-/sorbitol-6-phosphatase
LQSGNVGSTRASCFRDSGGLFWKVIFTCKAILFDLDGVLIDSTPAVARTWTAWAIQHGINPKVAVEKAHGRRSIETVRTLTPDLDAEAENKIVERMEIEDKEGVVALPGARELLASLPPERYAIVTSATRALARARLSYAGLPAPQNMICADDVVNGKPFPEPYLKGAELLGFAPKDCLVIEDAPAGIRSARSAGARVLAVVNTYPAEDLRQADSVTTSLSSVKAEMNGKDLMVKATGANVAR